MMKILFLVLLLIAFMSILAVLIPASLALILFFFRKSILQLQNPKSNINLLNNLYKNDER